MKKYQMLLPLMFLLHTIAGAQNDGISRFFNQYVDDERFTVVYVSPKMFQMVSKIEVDDPDWEKVRPIVADLTGLRVLNSEEVDGVAMFKDALSKVPAGEYSELLTVRDGEENVRIWTKDDGGTIIHELLLLVGSPDEFVLLSFTGKIDLDKISDLSKSLDVEGAQHLEKIKQKDTEGESHETRD